jgi:MFS family permease
MPLDFKILITARFLFTFAVQMQAVILGWSIYELFKTPISLGMIGLTEAIPALGLALYAGVIVDRSRPLYVYRWVILVSFISGLLMWLSNSMISDWPVILKATMLYGAAFLTGLARSFSQPAIFAVIPRMVERNQLVNATAIFSTTMQVARIAGPAVGGILFGFAGARFASVLVCLLLIISFVFLLSVRKQIPPSPKKHHASIKDELFSGFRFVMQHPLLFPSMALDMVSVLFGGVTALLPIFANEILLVGPKGLGALRAAPAIGAAIISFFHSYVPFQKNSGNWLFACVAGFGLCILCFGLSTSFELSLFILILSGIFDGLSMIIRSVVVQFSSPDSMRGKISAVNSIFIGSSNELGEVESGLAAHAFGIIPSVYFGGCMCLLTVGAMAHFYPALRKMNLVDLEKDHQIEEAHASTAF